MLREQFRKQAGESLRAMLERMPPDGLRAVRAERRKRNAS